NIPLQKYTTAAPAPLVVQDGLVEYPRSLSGTKYIFVRRSVYFGYELKLLISTAGGRFHFITAQGRHLFKETTYTVSTLPRAWLEPRANRKLVKKALRQITSVACVIAIPGRRDLSLPSPCCTPGSQGSWDRTIVRPTEDLLLFPQMFSVGRASAQSRSQSQTIRKQL